MKVMCKQCGNTSNNGTNFCSRKCRLKWVRTHNYNKRDWEQIEIELIKRCRTFDAEDLGQA